ncbi:hypothetical protein Bca4012_025932 [Brassica carinata]
MGLLLGLLTMELLCSLSNDGPKSSIVNHGVCDANTVVEGGRGEATEPSNRNTSEVAPQKEVVSFGKRHGLTNYRSVALGFKYIFQRQ